jgi:hypothetical protein
MKGVVEGDINNTLLTIKFFRLAQRRSSQIANAIRKTIEKLTHHQQLQFKPRTYSTIVKRNSQSMQRHKKEVIEF